MNNRRQVLYSITVFARSMAAVEGELRELLTGNTGIRIRRVGPRVFIEGGVSNEQELERIKHIASLYPGQVESLVVVGGVAADRKHNIQLDVYFVQFEKTRGYRVGVSWPSRLGPLQTSVSYNLVAGQYASGTASVVNQALLGLDMAAANGWAKVLKHSTVITANGAKANFASGGEENFQIVNNLSTGIQALTFGTNVEVLPRFDPGTGELEIKVDAKISELTQSVSASTSLPGRNTTDLGTLVNLKLGQALILSGIQTKVRRHTVGGVPLLSEIPLIGLLFGSHDDQLQEVDGAILLVPSVIEGIPKRNEQLLQQLMDIYQKAPADDAIAPVRALRKEARHPSPVQPAMPSVAEPQKESKP
jgi:pilus assembly protein CpaC